MSKLRDGHTSNLVKRFEQLALKSDSGGAGPLRSPVGAKRAPGSENAGAGAPLASIAAAQSALSAAIAHSSGPSAAALGGGARQRASSDAVVASRSPMLAGQSAAGDGSSAGSQQRRSRASTGDSLNARGGSPSLEQQMQAVSAQASCDDTQPPLQAGMRKSYFAALNKRADIKPGIKVSSPSWLSFAERCIDEARLNQGSGDLEGAYVKYMMACNIVTKKLKSPRDLEQQSEANLAKVRQDARTWVMDELEKIHGQLESRLRSEPDDGPEEPKAQLEMTPDQVDRMKTRFSQMYPENPVVQPVPVTVTSLQPPAMGRLESADSGVSTAAGTRLVAERQSRFDEIDAQVRQNDAGVQNLQSRNAALNPAASQPAAPVGNGILPSADGQGTDGGYFDPNATTCTAQELWGLMERSRTGVHGRPTILILDVRPHQDFVWGRIDHRYTVNVDPLGLKQKCTSKDIAKSLVLVSEEQQQWFRARGDFDLVVYVGQKMHSFSDVNSPELAALENLNSAVYHYEYETPLKHPPLFLIGGFEAWKKEVGPERCLWSEGARRTGAQQPKAQNAAAPSQPQVVTPVVSAPVAPDASSTLAPMSAGSVFDFFQQNAQLNPQLVQAQATRHQPTHTSVTHGYNLLSPGSSVVSPASAYYQQAHMPPKPQALVREAQMELNQRPPTVFDNPTYGFTGPVYTNRTAGPYPAVAPPLPAYGVDPQQQLESQMLMEQRTRRRAPPPPVPAAAQPPRLPPKPTSYTQQQLEQQQQPQYPGHAASRPGSTASASSLAPQLAHRPQMQAQLQSASSRSSMQFMQQPSPVNGTPGFYAHPVAAGSDPSLNGRMHLGANLRNSAAAFGQPMAGAAAVPAATGQATPTAPAHPRRMSQLSDTGAYGATGLKNFGNTCFMNSVLQCLAGTGPLTRYFMRGEWKKSLQRDGRGAEVAVEFARLIENMWRGQYGSLSPIGFRSAVGKCSEQFKGNDQEDAHEFGTFLLDALHESLNSMNPRPPPERDLTEDEEMRFEKLPDAKQAELMWNRYTRRNWSIVTSIFQGQIQSRLTCMSCKHTSTTYHTFTELSVPIPAVPAQSGKALVRKSQSRSHPVNIYQCLDAYSETEVLDGDNRWMCPRCRTKRKASKRLMISRLPLVLVVHLKRFSTIGHFREKLETNVLVPTRKLYMQNYVTAGSGQSMYNLYAVANHFGTLSSGHYTASVFNGLRDQWNYFDDTKVTPVHESQVATPAAYLLFFVQAQQP